MKTLIFFCAFLCLTFTSLAQQIREESRSMSLGANSCFVLPVSDLDVKTVEDLWIEFQKEQKGKNPKKDRKQNELFTDDLELPKISPNTVDLYSTLEEKNGAVELVVWFDLGGAFLSGKSHADKVPYVEEWLNEFGRKTRIKKVELELDAEEKKLKDLNKDLGTLVKEQKQLEGDIETWTKKIEEARNRIMEVVELQKIRQSEIDQQQTVIEQVKEKLKKVN